MPTTEKLKNKLMAKLTELFQLDQPDLDFGFYRIMQAKAHQVKSFIDKDLLQIIEDAFGQVDEGRKAELADNLEKAIQTAKDFGAPNPEETEPVKKAKAALDALTDGATAEADVYDHLYRFFERYYDSGDFISRRYYARENAGKAAPFAIPYNGEEVKLHWANADQYYIKTTEYFSNYSFDITQAAEIRKMPDGEKILHNIPKEPLKIHFRIVEASEGEHGNIKTAEDKKRFFVLHEDNPVEFNETQELVINFEYKALPGGKNTVDTETEKALKEKFTKSLNKGDMPNLAIAEKVIEFLSNHEPHERHEKEKNNNVSAFRGPEYLPALTLAAPTEKIKNRPLLAKYINQYTARNTMDYFIHKDLGTFLKRELDFYIKNEVMHLDDIENADAPAVESYLAKIKVLRKIATKLIDFLAQLEDFQKKLWLKKKFVTETNYCITLDRIPEELYGEIAGNKEQYAEWEKLGFIDLDVHEKHQKHENDLLATSHADEPKFQQGKFSCLSCLSWLKENDKLVLDTAFFTDDFKARLIASIEDFDQQCDGLLIHSENFQALNLLQERYREQVKCIHIDPPYNTATSGFLYKNAYQHSSWMSLMLDRYLASFTLLRDNGAFACHIDENEIERLHLVLDSNESINAGTLIWDKGSPVTGANGLATQHEYVLWRTKNNIPIKVEKQNIEQMTSKAQQLLKKYGNPDQACISEWRKWLRSNEKLSKAESIYDQIDSAGRIYRSADMTATDKRTNEKFHIPLIHPVTNKPCPVPSNGWRYTPETLKKHLDNDAILFGDNETKIPRRKIFITENESSQMPTIYRSGYRGKIELDALALDFPFAHSTEFYSYLLSGIEYNHENLILDFFGGSGTTGHSVIKLQRNDGVKRNFILVEMGNHFDAVLKSRIAKVIYSSDWKNGKPTSRDTGISHCFKYIRLESYEDTLNNLVFDENPIRNKAIKSNPSLKEDYMLRYLLDVETRGSQSLLNIDAFTDPTSYTLKIKKPGTDEQVVKNIDLIETFNYLIGLRLENMAAPQTFTASFTRRPDPELPEDQHTKLVVDGKIKQVNHEPHEKHEKESKEENVRDFSVFRGEKIWCFRKIEGWVPADPMNPNNGQKERVLIVWRKLTGNLEEDNLMLDEWFKKYRISTRDFEFDTIYVNGSNNLPNLKKDDENWKVRLIEEEFHQRMWEVS